MSKIELLYPSSYHNEQLSSKLLVFNINLQEFSQRVSYICTFQTNGMLSAEEAYVKLECLWKQLEKSQQEPGIGRVSKLIH